jgi:hypothetical protein
VDPLFRKDGRTVIPIKIGGSRNDPSFGLDAKRVFGSGDNKEQAGSKPATPTATTGLKPTTPPPAK